MKDEEYDYLKSKVLRLTGLDLESYKSQQMRRRLDGFIARSPAADVQHYFELVNQDRSVLKNLMDFLTINVSEFFRDAELWQVMGKNILPDLLRKHGSLNIWSAGCSNGAEAYTMAMILQGLAPGSSHRILATDLDDQTLGTARAGGPYAPADVQNVSRALLLQNFSHTDQGYFVNERLKNNVTFKRHNLLAEPFDTGFHMVICRNVVIYFSDEAKAQLFKKMYRSIKEDGWLFIGATETLLNARELGFQRRHASFYRKAGTTPVEQVRVRERRVVTPAR